MGHDCASRIVYVGQARLPQPLPSPAPSVVVELEVDPASRQIASACTNLALPGLQRLLHELLAGRRVSEVARSALLELEVRYSAPFAAAVRVAVQNALSRSAGVSSQGQAGYNGAPGASNGHGRARSIASARSSSNGSS